MDSILYYGDNLKILNEHVHDKSIDLIYLDPPFNSEATYNILFQEPTGASSKAQIEAFEDSWHWTPEAEKTFNNIVDTAPAEVVDMILAFKKFIKENDMLAYLTMMTIRLLELHRVLKDSGSIFLHCDPTASHYLKIVMDTIFGVNNFQNEIIWFYKTGGASSKRFAKKHDIILFYSKTDKFYFQAQKEKSFMMHKYGFKKSEFFIDPETGLQYTWVFMRDVWDLPSIGSADQERLGYPTQKPLNLLLRIIMSAAPKDGVILDPFCGCGTTISACEQLNRANGYKLSWIGIDITHLAINLIKWRLKNEYRLEADKDYKVVGEPKDLEGAKTLSKQDRFQFQWWALSLINARPYENKKKGADTGIDGYIYHANPIKADSYLKAIVSVKSGGVQVKDIRELISVVDREKSSIGVFITLEDPTRPMIEEAIKAGYFSRNVPKIQILTIKDLLEQHKLPNIPLQVEYRKKAEKFNEVQNLELFTEEELA